MAKKRGIGKAAVWYPTGMSGGGDPSNAFVKMRMDGSLDVVIGSVDIGEGMRTVMRQIAADEMGLPIEMVSVTLVDTDSSPFDTGTFASRLTHQTGNAVILACAEARSELYAIAADLLDASPEQLEARDGQVIVREHPEHAVPIPQVASHAIWGMQKQIAGRGCYGWAPSNADPVTGRGEPLHAMAYGATVAEVEVDTETGEVQVLRLVSAFDCGKAINPLLAEGQIEGGSAGGLGSALMEDLHPYYPSLDCYPKGFYAYMVPTIKDVPPLESVIVEVPSQTGPYGAKGMGEMTANSQAPAIVNAIHDAIGVWITDLPATPDKILRALDREARGTDETGTV